MGAVLENLPALVVQRVHDLPLFRYNVIVVDPPWDFDTYSNKGKLRGAEAHYDTMSFDEILDLPIGQLASDNCLLLLWVCSWMSPGHKQALLDTWGFTYKTELVWDKRTVNGKQHMGTGYRARSMHETVYLATIGNPFHKAFPSKFEGCVREHSRKPDEFYDLISRLVRPDYFRVDVFGRQSRDGWDVAGIEATKFDTTDLQETGRKSALLQRKDPLRELEIAGQGRLILE
ncbi:MT-A70 family protein [Roseibium sp. TrichSKD4]|nr:MT-A70 family protein [Roseibium sp. TrichSKD4]